MAGSGGGRRIQWPVWILIQHFFSSPLIVCVSGRRRKRSQDGAGWGVGGLLRGGPDAPPRTVACLGDILLYMPIWTRATMECKEVCIPGWEKFQRCIWTKPKHFKCKLDWVCKLNLPYGNPPKNFYLLCFYIETVDAAATPVSSSLLPTTDFWIPLSHCSFELICRRQTWFLHGNGYDFRTTFFRILLFLLTFIRLLDWIVRIC